jgi:hypothetical protein
MKEPHSIGAKVRQVVPVIEGAVADVRFDAASKSFHSLVEWTDADGQAQSRWFADTEIAAVGDPQ